MTMLDLFRSVQDYVIGFISGVVILRRAVVSLEISSEGCGYSVYSELASLEEAWFGVNHYSLSVAVCRVTFQDLVVVLNFVVSVEFAPGFLSSTYGGSRCVFLTWRYINLVLSVLIYT